MKLYELNPHIRYAKVHSKVFNSRREISVCYDARLFYFLKGSGKILINGKNYPISNYTAIYLPPLTRYRFFVDRAGETELIILDFDLVSSFAHITSSLGTPSERSFEPSLAPKYELPAELSLPICVNVPSISSELSEFVEGFVMRKTMYRERSSAKLKLTLLEMLERSSATEATHLCESVLDFVRERYSDSTLTNKEIAEKFNYHPNYINLIVKKGTGRSLREYIIRYRLGIAKDLLLTGKDSINSIAWSTGFSSAAYFTKMFKERNGITPGEFRCRTRHGEI